MKRLLFSASLTMLLSLAWVSSFANHIFGGELLYTNISGNRYAITITFYGDCAASSFSTFKGSTPEVRLYDGNVLKDSVALQMVDTGLNVSPVCPADSANTTCNGGTLPGVTRFIYSDTLTLPYTSATWKFVFNGNMGNALAGRSTQLTNINQAASSGTTLFYLEAVLNNTNAPNSSPEYSTIPTPFYCINVPEQYNQGALDPDNDSLSFALVPAIDAYTGSPVDYISPYTATSPMSAVANDFTFSNLSGQMSFTPSQTQDALIVCRVSEYRNGVLIGTSEREMAFIVLSSCQAGDATISAPQSITGAAVADTNSTVLNVCVGTPSVSFTVQVANSSSDSVSISDANIPPGATINILNNNGQNPQLSFNWNTATVPVGVYNLLVNYNDSHCPISSHESIAYTINIINQPTFTDTLLSPTECIHQAYMQYNLTNGAVPRTVTISRNGNVVATYTDNTGIIKDSLPAGNYTATIGAGNTLCPATFNFSVVDSGTLPASVQQSNYCIGDTATMLVVNVPNDSTVVTWYDVSENVLPTEPSFSAAAAGSYTFYFKEKYAACQSLLDTVLVNVYADPTITILDSASEVYCYGDIIHLAAAGAKSYTWTPQSQLTSDEQGDVYVKIYQPESFTVYGTDAHGCRDSASITFSNIARCCLFSYPTAFTPNNDGKNDTYGTIIYGNTIYYSINIFDRWGNCVFHTNDPNRPWDGTYKGKPCAMDTYNFIVEAQCATGHVEKHHGNLTLIR